MPEDRPSHATTLRARAVSLAFWICLLTAAGLYASVTLSPKLLTYFKLKDEHYRNQVQLVALEQEVGYLNKVADALGNDPEFAAEMARADFDAARPGDERIVMDDRLSLPDRPVKHPPARLLGPSWLQQPAFTRVAGDDAIRRRLLAAAASLVIVAFTFLHVSTRETARAQSGAATGLWRRLTSRYGKGTGRPRPSRTPDGDGRAGP